VRIAAFQAALERMGGSSFWSRSLEVDGWATARTLLRWRDELVNAGWTRTRAWSSPRLADLARADEAAADMPRGLADRVSRSSASGSPIHPKSIRSVSGACSAGWRAAGSPSSSSLRARPHPRTAPSANCSAG